MKTTCWLACSLVVMALATKSQGQPASTAAADLRSLDAPTNNSLVLSNVSGEVEVLDSQGLILESSFTLLPRIKLADLSPVDLRALLETKTAYATLTTFSSLYGTNGQEVVLENQLQKVWRQGNSLAEKIQTRLEILADLREYNITLALLPGNLDAAGQYALHADAVNDRLENRELELDPAWPEPGFDAPGNREARHEEWERLERANDRAMTANGQAVAAQQQVAGYLAKCATLSARLASHGINVPAAPPFTFIPPLTLKAGVDEERMAN